MTDATHVQAVHGKATSDLAYIRRTMDRSSRFTALSGRGGVGVSAVVAGPAWSDHFMALGFGGIQFAGGLFVVRRYGS